MAGYNLDTCERAQVVAYLLHIIPSKGIRHVYEVN